MAAESARKDYGGTVDLRPLDALLYTVKRGAQLVHYWQTRALNATDDETHAIATDREQRALGDLNRWAKNAVDGGVARMQVELASRTAEHITAAAEQGLAALETAMGRPLTAAERTAYAQAFGAGLARLEAGTIDGHATDV